MIGARLAAPDEYDFVVPFGACTAVVVEPRVLLTSAHCVPLHPSNVVVAGASYDIEQCEADPDHHGAEALHDVGFCILKQATALSDLPQLDATAPIVGQPAALVGFGETGPLTHDSPTSHIAETTVTATRHDYFEAGTSTQTACRGDSGGGVFRRGSSGMRLLGLIHGPSGAICASSAVITRIQDSAGWLERRGALQRDSTTKAPVVVVLLLSVGLAWIATRGFVRLRLRDRQRR